VDLNADVKLTAGEISELAFALKGLSVPFGDIEQMPEEISAPPGAEEFVVLRPKLIFFPRLPGFNAPA